MIIQTIDADGCLIWINVVQITHAAEPTPGSYQDGNIRICLGREYVFLTKDTWTKVWAEIEKNGRGMVLA